MSEPIADSGSMPISSLELLPGQLIDGRLRIINLIGLGSSAAVYRARHLQLEQDVALKVLFRTNANENATRRFIREARALCSINHPNVVKVYAIGETDNHPYMVMDLVDGTSLRDLIKTGDITPADTCCIVRQICSGLQAAHDVGVIHRDVKPANIMIARTDDSLQAKILDFGLAWDCSAPGSHALTQTGVILGTPTYMSPEQCRDEVLDPGTDIYSLGCVLYECLTGRPPFTESTAFELMSKHINEEVSLNLIRPPLRKIVMKALAKSVSERYASMSAFSNDLDGVDAIELERQSNASKGISNNGLLLFISLIVVSSSVAVAVCYEKWRRSEQTVSTAAPRIKTRPKPEVVLRVNELPQNNSQRLKYYQDWLNSFANCAPKSEVADALFLHQKRCVMAHSSLAQVYHDLHEAQGERAQRLIVLKSGRRIIDDLISKKHILDAASTVELCNAVVDSAEKLNKNDCVEWERLRLKVFEQFPQLKSELRTAIVGLAASLGNSGHHAESLPHYEAVLKDQPDPGLRREYACALRDCHRCEDACRQARMAIEEVENYDATDATNATKSVWLLLIAQLEEELGDCEEAAKAYSSAAKYRQPKDAWYPLLRRAKLLCNLKRYDECAGIVLKMQPLDSSVDAIAVTRAGEIARLIPNRRDVVDVVHRFLSRWTKSKEVTPQARAFAWSQLLMLSRREKWTVSEDDKQGVLNILYLLDPAVDQDIIRQLLGDLRIEGENTRLVTYLRPAIADAEKRQLTGAAGLFCLDMADIISSGGGLTTDAREEALSMLRRSLELCGRGGVFTPIEFTAISSKAAQIAVRCGDSSLATNIGQVCKDYLTHTRDKTTLIGQLLGNVDAAYAMVARGDSVPNFLRGVNATLQVCDTIIASGDVETNMVSKEASAWARYYKVCNEPEKCAQWEKKARELLHK